MKITPFGKRWEWSRSIWLVWLLFPFGFFSFISFFYIGARTKTFKWMVAAGIYLLIVVQFFVIDEFFHEDHFMFDLSVGLILLGWIAAWVHAILARIEYLQKIAQRVPGYNRTDISQRTTIQSGAVYKKPKPPKPMKSKSSKKESKQTTTPLMKININKATEQELRQLPSIGGFMAKEIIRARKRVSEFTSYAHLVAVLKVQPHVFAKAKPYITFSDDDLVEKEEIRAVSSSKKKAGRIVDY